MFFNAEWRRRFVKDGLLSEKPGDGATGIPAGASFINRETGKVYVNIGDVNYSIFRNGFTDRFTLEERFKQKPALSAVLTTYTASVAAAEAVATNVANKDFLVAGSNMTTALATLAANGGFTMTTAGGANTTDAAYVIAHSATNQSNWNINWNHTKLLTFDAVIETEAAIVTDGVIYAGLKLTGTDTVATDADQAFFRYGVGTSAFFQTIDTNNNVADNTNTTDVTVANSTIYHLRIQIDGNLIPRYYINGILKATGIALKSTAVNLKPVIGCRQTANSSDIALTVHGISCSQDF